jgi:hypothetical protein
MATLYFMNREFEGRCLDLDEAVESREIRLLFEDSWYWLHYRFFNCRDALCSETSAALRTHVYNLVAMLCKTRESLPAKLHRSDEEIGAIIAELVEIAECSRAFPISLWIHGDEASKAFLDEKIAGLPPADQIERLMELPHLWRLEQERLPYAHVSDQLALARYRKEWAAYNKRRKLRVKEEQRTKQKR